MTCQPVKAPRAYIFPFWSRIDMDSENKDFCLVPDLKIVKPKEIANDLKIYQIKCLDRKKIGFTLYHLAS